MKKISKAESQDKEKDWVIYSPDQYEEAIEEMVHHSFKLTHSAITGGGVRVSAEAGVKLPYISVRTLIGHGHEVLTDHYGKGPKSINIHQQINAVAVNLAENAPASDVALIKKLLVAANQKNYVKSNGISPRLRQILLPTNEGYLAVSPLSCAGIGVLIANQLTQFTKRVNAQDEDKSHQDRPLRKIKRASLPLGGSKPFNVGNLVYKITSPILGGFPTANNTLRHALSLFHSGQKSLSFPPGLVGEYLSWRNALSGATSHNQDARDTHAKYLQRFVRHWQGLGADARDLLIEHRQALPDQTSLTSSSLGLFERGLIDPQERNAEWNYQFASKLAHRLAKLEKDDVRRFEYTQAEINTIAKTVRDILA